MDTSPPTRSNESTTNTPIQTPRPAPSSRSQAARDIIANRSSPPPPARHQRSIESTAGHTPPPARLGAGLNEFRSLLEAAQRIADSASLGSDAGGWLDEDRPHPVIRRSSAAAAGPDDLRRRVPLTRQYSGRPHVPGEDSGSEDEDEEEEEQRVEVDDSRDREELRMEAHQHFGQNEQRPESRGRDEHDPTAHNFVGANLRRMDGNRAYLEAAQARGEQLLRERDTAMRASSELPNQRDLESVRRAAAITRDLRRHQQVRRYREEPAHYAATGPTPTRESFYDWAPQPRDTHEPPALETRSRSNSVRRWRPSERLQDYASNHARRESAGETGVQIQSEPQEYNDNSDSAQRSYTGPPISFSSRAEREHDLLRSSRIRPDRAAPSGEFGDHNDIVNRVERALQEYRMARRALRASQEDLPSQLSGQREHPETRGLIYRPPSLRRNSQNERADNIARSTSATTGTAAESRDLMSLATTAERWRRDDTVRQRIREQARERRRRVVNSMLDQDANSPLATGPLFESTNQAPREEQAENPERWHERTRRLVEKVRTSETRANNLELKRAKAMLKYLAMLRDQDMTRVKAWTLAAELGLHNQSLHEDPQEKLAMSVDELPDPLHCSWLESGMTWSGTQSADDIEDQKRLAHARAEAEILRRHREQRERIESATRQNEAFRARLGQDRDPLERALAAARNSMQVLEDAERDLDQMLERSEQLLMEDSERRQRIRHRDVVHEPSEQTLENLMRLDADGDDARTVQQEPKIRPGHTKDHWNVKVALHSIDWTKMTLTGTMTASHMPGSNHIESSVDTAMDSFFTGEIIDFSTHGLDTLSSSERFSKSHDHADLQDKHLQDDWKVGGSETDLTYWAGIGPFKQEIDLAIRDSESALMRAEMLQQPVKRPDSPVPDHGTSMEADGKTEATFANQPSMPPLSDDEKYDVKLRTMQRLLSDTEWLNENINHKGWILMRWKERCFVAPGTETNPEPTRPWIPNPPPAESLTSLENPESDATYLRWASFYRRRQNERGQRIYTTNAAEREEMGTSTARAGVAAVGGGRDARQPTWGLTISGFYYVALHRQTGRIEALYYDCGSAPFQRLRMRPVLSTSMGPAGATKEDIAMEGGVSVRDDLRLVAGLRTAFNMVEFR